MDANWTPWDGSAPMPLTPDTIVQVRHRDGYESKCHNRVDFWHGDEPLSSNWYHNDDPFDIVAYRIIDAPPSTRS